MTTIKLNNKNKTEINFSYDNGLPYKKAIRPAIEYGDWKKNPQIALIKVNLSDDEILLFKDIFNINCHRIVGLKNEIWLDLNDVYLVLNANDYLDEKLQTEKFMLAFLKKNEILSSWGFSK